MDYFTYKDHVAYCEDVSLQAIAKQYGTPVYVYSRATLHRHCQEFLKAFSGYQTLACFAVKANSGIAYLKNIAQQGLGADIVSLGELERSLLAGFDPKKIVFSGVGKTDAELTRALLVGIYCFNVESEEELIRLSRVAEREGVRAQVSIRINPHVDARTHPKIATGLYETKFGVDEGTAYRLIQYCLGQMSLKLIGLSCHIGSQILDLEPLRLASEQMAEHVRKVIAMGAPLEFVGMGGGLGIRYNREEPPSLAAYAETLITAVKHTKLRLVVEPGRVIAGNTGVLLTQVLGLKSTPTRNFAVVDASMSELIRPALYGSFHDIVAVHEPSSAEKITYDVVGPVCETSDTLGQARALAKLSAGDLLFLRSCGAYGSSMSSNYNSRPRPAEVMVDGEVVHVIRAREELVDLWQKEQF